MTYRKLNRCWCKTDSGLKRLAVGLTEDENLEAIFGELTNASVTYLRPAAFYTNFYSSIDLTKGKGFLGKMLPLRYWGLWALLRGRTGLLINIFATMKFYAASILCVMVFFLIEPVYAGLKKKEVKTCCEKKQAKNRSECATNCNPFFTCCNCQYLLVKKAAIEPNSTYNIQYFHLSDEPTVKGFSFDCWHPPQV